MERRDKEILRSLASRVAEIAFLPEQEEKRRMWYEHNSLKCTKPLVLCFPEGSWDELIPRETLQCKDELARSWEYKLRMKIYAWEHFKEDKVVDATFDITPQIENTGWGLGPNIIHSEINKGAFRWDPPIKTYEDLSKLRFPEVIHNREETERLFELAHKLFDGILKVRKRGLFWWSLGLIGELTLLRGLEQVMYDLYDNPQFVHKAMRFIMEGRLKWLENLEKEGLLSLNNENDYVGSGGLGFTEELPNPDFNGYVRLEDLWGFAEAQEAVGFSPSMWEEFVLQYQLPILEKFGLNCYGCCEPLHDKFDILLKKVPRLRRISISPWCDRKIAAEKVQNKYIYSWKPHPGYIADVTFDPEAVRKYIRSTLEITKGCIVEIILKDTHTCRNQPERFDIWTKIVQEEVEKIS